MRCEDCGMDYPTEFFPASNSICYECHTKDDIFQGLEVPNLSAPTTVDRPSSGKAMNIMEYKVLTQKDRFFGGKFNPDKLEQAINSYANEGWSVVSVTTASFPSLAGGSREEIIVVMERGKKQLP